MFNPGAQLWQSCRAVNSGGHVCANTAQSKVNTPGLSEPPKILVDTEDM